MTKEHIILDQKSIGVSQYFFGLSERKNGIRYEDELEECGIPSKTWKQAGQMVRRYLYRRKANVTAQSILLAIGYNINKLHHKIQAGRTGRHLFPLKQTA